MSQIVGFIFEQCGIDLSAKKYGVFDPDEQKETEMKAINLNYPPRSMFTEMVIRHNQKMDKWIQEYTEAHHENPLQS